MGLAAHHLLDEAPEWLDPRLRLDAIEEVGVVDVPGGQIGQRPVAAILELDQRWALPAGQNRLVPTAQRLSWDFSSAQTTSSSGGNRPPSKRRW